MKVLLDQGLPRSTAASLKNWGVDAVHTGEVGLSRAEDEEILRRATAENRVVVTLDADFHRLMALSGASQPSVIRLRVQGLKGEELVQLLKGLFEQHETVLESGALVSVRDRRSRIRRLPVGPGRA